MYLDRLDVITIPVREHVRGLLSELRRTCRISRPSLRLFITPTATFGVCIERGGIFRRSCRMERSEVIFIEKRDVTVLHEVHLLFPHLSRCQVPPHVLCESERGLFVDVIHGVQMIELRRLSGFDALCTARFLRVEK